ncbi:MAG TPA: 3-deoxy-D-manno-octulosonic acid transferase [Geobacteraceae bacterium]|nr:3-deoxy-D-manno-octulosonic acid transferase [Geobacteraceae bacterium]
MYLAYNVLICLALPLIVVYHQYRSASRGRPAAFLPRFGFLGRDKLEILAGRRPIWVHAVSVGETIAVKPLLAELKRRYPESPIVLSNMTETGRSVAESLRDVDLVIYFPFDYPFAVTRLLATVNPRLVVIVETELWPNFLRSARRLGIPTMIVNGRISDRSYGRYRTLRSFFAAVLGDLAACCMQSREDAGRVIALGAPESRVVVTRNLKFDIPCPNFARMEREAIRNRFAIPESVFVFTAGSTHQGEDGAVLDAFAALRQSGAQAVLVLVPRHPERSGEVAGLISGRGLSYRLRSSLRDQNETLGEGDVLLVDTVGELMSLYAVSDLVFVGGSLVPVGGHNLLEPASMGVPTLFGPHMTNFREIAAMSISYASACQVADAGSLAREAVALFQDAEGRRLMRESGRRLIAEQGGATGLNMAVIDRLLRGG